MSNDTPANHPPPMKDFFISYNRADRQGAEWIAWQLEESDYTTVLQAWDFRPGANFALEMHRASTEAERTIAVLSPAYCRRSSPNLSGRRHLSWILLAKSRRYCLCACRNAT